MSLIKNNPHKDCLYRNISYIVIIFCIAIRFYFYTSSKFFWQDEAFLYFTLKSADIASVITQNNCYYQTYPSLFGLVEWLFLSCIGKEQHILRFIPFVSSCLFVILLYKFAKKFLNEQFAVICLAICSFNTILLIYCDEFKQYSIEAVVTILLLILYINNSDKQRIPYSIALYCVISILFSVPAPFVVATIILCFYMNCIKKTKTICNFFANSLYFFRINFNTILFMLIVSLIYYFICLKTGDANNGNAWENGMIPSNISEIPKWITENFFPIMSRLMSNSSFLTVGSIFFCFSIAGAILLIRLHHPFAMFLRIFIIIFLISIYHIYSLGHSNFGLRGARLSIYLIPILIINSSYFIFFTINKIILPILNCVEHGAHNYKIRIYICNGTYIVFVVICFILSVFSTKYVYEHGYEDEHNFREAFQLINRNRNSIILSEAFVWYSLEYYNECNCTKFKFIKIGNQETPSAIYPPISYNTITTEIYNYIENIEDKQLLLIFVPRYRFRIVQKFITKFNVSLEWFNFEKFYIFMLKK